MSCSRLFCAILMSAVLLSCKQDKTDWKEVEIGFENPEARSNPFLATERFLEKMGISVEPVMNLAELPDDRTVLLLPAEAVRTRFLAANLIGWVSEGGHLIYLLEGGGSFANDFATDPATWNWETEEEDEEVREDRLRFNHPLLFELGVKLEKREEDTESIRLHGLRHEVSIPPGQGFEVPNYMTQMEGSSVSGSWESRGFATFPYDRGRITLIADAHPFRNRFLQEKDHAPLLWNLVLLEPATIRTWIVRGMDSSFWELLWRHGWMPLVSLGLLIAFWLWKSMSRFGPIVPTPEPVSRDFSEHLRRTGQFLWRRKAVDALLEPIRHRIRRRAHDHLLMDTSGDATQTAPAFAERSGLPEDWVRDLLDHPVPTDSQQFTRMVRDLQNLEKHT